MQHTAFVDSIPELYDEHLGPLLFHDYARDLAHRSNPALRGELGDTPLRTPLQAIVFQARKP